MAFGAACVRGKRAAEDSAAERSAAREVARRVMCGKRAADLEPAGNVGEDLVNALVGLRQRGAGEGGGGQANRASQGNSDGGGARLNEGCGRRGGRGVLGAAGVESAQNK